MKKSFQFLTIIFTGLLFGNACAQSTTVDKILKTGKDVQKVDTALSSVLNSNTINTIGGLFNRKSKKKNEADTIQAKPSSSSHSAINTIPENTFSSAGNLKAGENIDGVKQLDADKLGPFIKGAAILQKINATALIDASGNFIIPYNQYKISYIPSAYSQSYVLPVGIFAAEKDHTVYLINPKGKILFSSQNTNINLLRADPKYVYVQERVNGNWDYEKVTCIDEEGNKYLLKGLLYDISEGLFYGNPGGKAGYYNIKNELVIPSVYNEANRFSDGLALVGKKDEFGTIKYGYIDKKGKVVIPFIYTRKPDDFSSGLAKVLPMADVGFIYAFINKGGKIIYKGTHDDYQKYGEFSAFRCGIAISSNIGGNQFVMDTTGNIITKDEFLKKIGIENGSQYFFPHGLYIWGGGYWVTDEETTEIAFWSAKGKTNANGGLIDLKEGKVTLPPVFFVDKAGLSVLMFDPVSGLAYTEIRDASNHVLKEGYINRDGMYVMIKGAPSTW